MSAKRKNDDFSGPERLPWPASRWYERDKHLQFYVDATPLHCVDSLHQLESKSEYATTYRVNVSEFETGYAVEIHRSKSTLKSSSHTLVTVYVSPYDLDNKRTFVVIRSVLVGPVLMSLMMFLAGLCFLGALVSFPAGSLTFLVLMPASLVPAVFFVPSRLKSLYIVANQLRLLEK
jgi:hypothetical protein